MKYLIAKIQSNNIEYGKIFDNETDAIRAAAELNETAEENGWADIVQYMALPCVVLPRGAE